MTFFSIHIIINPLNIHDTIIIEFQLQFHAYFSIYKIIEYILGSFSSSICAQTNHIIFINLIVCILFDENNNFCVYKRWRRNIVHIIQITRSQCPILYVEFGWFIPEIIVGVGQTYWLRSLLLVRSNNNSTSRHMQYSIVPRARKARNALMHSSSHLCWIFGIFKLNWAWPLMTTVCVRVG